MYININYSVEEHVGESSKVNWLMTYGRCKEADCTQHLQIGPDARFSEIWHGDQPTTTFEVLTDINRFFIEAEDMYN
jgi:hypothetical protein